MDHDNGGKLGEGATASRKAGVRGFPDEASTVFCQKSIG